MSFSIKFENGLIPIHKCRQGTLVRYCDELMHIKHIYQNAATHHFMLVLEGYDSKDEVASVFVEWLDRKDL